VLHGPERIEHSVEKLVGQHIYGLAPGYEDLNDHDWLRCDPLMAVLSGKEERRVTTGFWSGTNVPDDR
jgi:hypothetical protein